MKTCQEKKKEKRIEKLYYTLLYTQLINQNEYAQLKRIIGKNREKRARHDFEGRV